MKPNSALALLLTFLTVNQASANDLIVKDPKGPIDVHATNSFSCCKGRKNTNYTVHFGTKDNADTTQRTACAVTTASAQCLSGAITDQICPGAKWKTLAKEHIIFSAHTLKDHRLCFKKAKQQMARLKGYACTSDEGSNVN